MFFYNQLFSYCPTENQNQLILCSGVTCPAWAILSSLQWPQKSENYHAYISVPGLFYFL